MKKRKKEKKIDEITTTIKKSHTQLKDSEFEPQSQHLTQQIFNIVNKKFSHFFRDRRK